METIETPSSHGYAYHAESASRGQSDTGQQPHPQNQHQPHQQPSIGLPQNIAFSRGMTGSTGGFTGARVDLTSDAGQVAQALHDAKGKGMVGGISVLMRLRFETWLEERMKGPLLRKMEVRKQVAEAQKHAEIAQNALTGTLHDRNRDGHLQQIELNQLNRQRLMSDLAQYTLTDVSPGSASNALMPAGYPQDDPAFIPPAVQAPAQITAEQVEALALRAAMTLNNAVGTGESFQEMWLDYRAKLYQTMPHNIAQEVERRIHELLAILN